MGNTGYKMKRIIALIIVLSLIFSLSAASAAPDMPETVNNTVSGYVSVAEGDIELVSQTKIPSIYVDENDYPGVIRTANDLIEDIQAVTDVTANIVNNAADADIIIGTIGKSSAVDGLIAENKLDVSEVEHQWEAFTLQNVDGKLVIAGADKRGTVYGIYDLSEKMGVSPWEWWADVAPSHADAVYVSLPENGYTEGASSVKYRGVFLNQEYNLWNWAKSLDGDVGIDTQTYQKIFELLLRLKANYLWPAMHEYTQAFNVNPENARMADEYGIVMGTSHCEMLLRNNMGELLAFQERWIAANPDKNLYMFKDGSLGKDVAYDYTDTDKDGNPVHNKAFIEDYWRERIRANKDYESNFTIGMRGVHDGAWNPVNAKTNEEKIALLEEIIAKQREILSEEIGKPAEEIPQTFIPYKEILPLYNAGLNVPDDVTIMWTNDNYGHIRQNSNAEERERSGGGGMYYHVSYFGRPSSVIWNGGTQLGLIKEEMTKAYDSGADTVWVLNVGPLKPFENQMEYFLDLGRNIGKVRETSVKEYVKDNAKRYFDFTEEQANEYAEIQCEFLELANARRPDFMTQGVYSITSYGDEGQKVMDKYAELLKRSEALYHLLPENKKAAFYELQLYAVKSAENIINTFVNADKAALYKAQKRGASVNQYSEKSTSAWAKLTSDMDMYNTMLDGKWNNMVNPFQKEESGSWDIMRNWKINNSTAVLETVDTLPYTEMGIAVEDQRDIKQKPALAFSGYTKDVRFIDIFNAGTGSFDWNVSSDVDWIIFNKASGTVYNDDRIYAGIDWDSAPSGVSSAVITVTQYIGENAVKSEEIAVKLNNDVKDLPEKTYAEANGYVSIEAEHFSGSAANGNYEWIEQDDFGRSGTSMKFMPDTEKSSSDNSAYLEYDIYFESTGTFDVDLYRMPTLNERGTVNCSVGIDEAVPTLLKGNNVYYNNSNGTDKWGKSILNNIEVLTATVNVTEAGIHQLKLYGVDTGTVVDKMVITTGTKYESFYGAPESYNTTYNNQPAKMPAAKPASTESAGDITALFSPKLHTVGINLDDSGLGVITGSQPRLVTPESGGAAIIAVYTNDGTLSQIQTSEHYDNGAYVFANALNLTNGETVKGMVWSSLSQMQPITGVYGETAGNNGMATGIEVIKLSSASAARVTVAAYDADGVMLNEKTITHDFSTAQINEKITVPIVFNIPESTAELQAIIYDSEENLNALSPSYMIKADNISPMASYDSGVIQVKTSIDRFTGKEAICRISDSLTNETVYIHQETIAENTFKSIKTGELNSAYDVRIGVSDDGLAVNEKAYTAQNITTDNDEANHELYHWDFSADITAPNGTDVPVVGGNAVYNAENKAVQMTSTAKSGGKMTVNLSEPITSVQGTKTIITSNIAYGKNEGQYMDYSITDSNGKELIKTHVNMYNALQSIQIGGVEKTNGKLQDNDGIRVSKTDNSALKNGYSTFTATLDADTKTITLNIKNKEGESTYTGKFPEDSSYDVSALNFSTTHNAISRSCYVGNMSIRQTTAPSYNIVFAVTDMLGTKIEHASVTVTDGKFATVIKPESDGTYHLCDGVYTYTVSADGYTAVTDEFELSQATESKTVQVKMIKE